MQGRVYRTWQEAAEREVTLPACSLAEIAALGVSARVQLSGGAGVRALAANRAAVGSRGPDAKAGAARGTELKSLPRRP